MTIKFNKGLKLISVQIIKVNEKLCLKSSSHKTLSGIKDITGHRSSVTACFWPPSTSPAQLAGVPDQVPSAWHSLMLVPWRSNSGRHRTPQAASKWLLHTFWIKKPFSGGGSAGQYTTETKAERRTAVIESKDGGASVKLVITVFISGRVWNSLTHVCRKGSKSYRN